jgi:hypothetical protein
MEDYLDKKLRALINEIIYEGKAETQKTLVGTDREYRPGRMILSAFKKVFTIAGFTGIIGAGLIYEKDFTIASLGAGFEGLKDVFDAIKVASKTENNKIETFLSYLRSENKKNAYQYLKKVNELNRSNRSVTADFAERGYKFFKESFSLNIDDPSDDDFKIYEAFMNKKMEDVFTKTLFELNQSKQFVATSNNPNDYSKPLDKKIYALIKSASDASKDARVRQSEIKVAYDTYNAAIEMSKGPNELGVTSLLVMANNEPGYIESLVGLVGDAVENMADFNKNIRDALGTNNNS